VWREIGLARVLTLWGAIAAAGAAGCILLGVVSGANFFWDRFHDLASGSGSGRVDIWRFALTQWWHEHFWFGIGVQGFRHLDFSQVTLTSTAHPHNAVVQLLLETGIVGALLAALTLAFLLASAWRNMARVPAERLAIFLCFFGVAGCSLASTSFFHVWWFVFMFVPLAWALGWSSSRSGASKL
jgi:O-antigen ligase